MEFPVPFFFKKEDKKKEDKNKEIQDSGENNESMTCICFIYVLLNNT